MASETMQLELKHKFNKSTMCPYLPMLNFVLSLCPLTHSALCPSAQGRGAEGANEGPEAADVLAGDGPMGQLRGELGPSFWSVGLLANLLPHLQEPHPAAAHHEHRSVCKTQWKHAQMGIFSGGKKLQSFKHWSAFLWKSILWSFILLHHYFKRLILHFFLQDTFNYWFLCSFSQIKNNYT